MPHQLVWFALLGLGLFGLVLVALARSEPHDVPWYLSHLLSLMVAVGFVTTAKGQPVATAVLAAYAFGLPILVLIVGFGALNPWDELPRVQLFTSNPNLLGADLVAAFFAVSLLRPKGPWVWVLPLVAVAVVLTGSRTALLALAIGSCAWLLVPSTLFRVRSGLGVAALMVVGFVAIANHQVHSNSSGPNLISLSTSFDDRVWTVYGDSTVSVTPNATDGPYPRTRADRIVATTQASRLALYQSIGNSVDGTSYVASIYLRADVPQRIVLSNHLAQTTCDVTTYWSRCVTPAGIGNGHLMTQFRLETVEEGQFFDVYGFGPQYEVGTAPTAYDSRRRALLPSVVATRFALRSLAPAELYAQRRVQLEAGWTAFQSAPLFGSGIAWRDAAFSLDGYAKPHHAHNLLVERLAVDGLVGVTVWLLIAAAVLTPVILAYGWRGAPWLLALIVLNTWDMTWFHSGSYFTSAIVAGSAINRLRSVGHEGKRFAVQRNAWKSYEHATEGRSQ